MNLNIFIEQIHDNKWRYNFQGIMVYKKEDKGPDEIK